MRDISYTAQTDQVHTPGGGALDQSQGVVVHMLHVSADRFPQLPLKIQVRNFKSFVVCMSYRFIFLSFSLL